MLESEIEQVNQIDKDANVYTDSVVVTTENGKKKAFDFIDYIETSDNIIAKKIKNLRQYISEEELRAVYENSFGTITEESVLESNLEQIFTTLANYITELPNGIVIDLETGLKDEDRSFDQSIEYGIYSQSSIIENVDKKMSNDIENMILKSLNSDNEKVNYVLGNFQREIITFADMKEEVDKFLKKDESEMNLSDVLKEISKESKAVLKGSEFEMDPHLFEICRLQIMLRDPKNIKNTQMNNILLSKIKQFYIEHPGYEGRQLPVLNADGTLNNAGIEKMDQYREAYQKIIMLEHFDSINGLTPSQIVELSKTERSHVLLCAFAGLKYENSTDIKNQELLKESKRIIKELSPNLDLNNPKALANFFKSEMGFDGNIEELTLQEMIEITSLQLKDATERYIEKDTESLKENKLDISEFDWDSSKRKFHKSVMKNYFVGSKINFSENDEKQYNELYKRVTVDSWIENKENAIKLRYAALITIRDEYKNNPVGTYTEKKLVEIEKSIEEFEKKFGKVDLTEKKGEVSFSKYREQFVTAGITKYLTRDASDWSEGVDYSELDEEHKKGYIRNVLVVLEDKENPNPYLKKIALRRLELMNSPGKEFIKIHENGKYEINRELILEEYKKMSKYQYPNYEELAQSALLRKNEYLLKKLEEYTKLDPKAFVGLDDRDDLDGSTNQIERARYLSNQKSIHQIVQEGKIKRDTATIQKSPYERDLHLFEISKLQIMLRDPKNVENTQMYSILLSKIKDFYKAHPEYEKRQLPILNKDGTLNESKIAEMEQYSEAYQRIVILSQLDNANGLSGKSFEKLSPEERRHVLLCAFAGLKYEKNADSQIRNLSKESMRIIKQSYPGLNLNDEKEIAKFFKNEMGFDVNIEKLSLDELIQISSLQVKEATENYIEKDTESYVDRKIDLSTLDLDSGKRKFHNSVMKNYFVGSKIKFNERDEKLYNETYQHFTVESWIENKENALKLRYKALTTIRDEYRNNPSGTYTDMKLVEIERAIKDFEGKYGKIDTTEKEGDVTFELYRQQFVNAGLTKYITRDASDWSDGVDYSELDNEHKKGYIRNALVALEYKNPDFYLTKIALRRLELMNSEGREFVKIHENGEYEINKELILEEYTKMSNHKYSSYEELAQSAKLRKNEYLLQKLEEYTKLDEKAFVKLDNKEDYKRSMEQIEKARFVSNQKRIHEIIQGESKKEEKRPNRRPKQISDDEVFGRLEFVDINTQEEKAENLPDSSRDETKMNQEETNSTDELAGSVSEIKVDSMNTTAIKEQFQEEKDSAEKLKGSFVDKIKEAFSKAKDSILKFIRNEEKPKLLDTGKIESKKEMTDEEKAARYNAVFMPSDVTPTIKTSETRTAPETEARGTER